MKWVNEKQNYVINIPISCRVLTSEVCPEQNSIEISNILKRTICVGSPCFLEGVPA